MGILNSFKRGLQKTRDFVTEGFNRIAANMGFFDEDMLDDLEMLLIQADVGIAAAGSIMDEIRDEIKKVGDISQEAVLQTLERSMLAVLGQPRHLNIEEGTLTIILLVGVNGTGKTTTAGKLCARYKKTGYNVLLGAADTFRAAAIEQLSHWGEMTGTPVIAHQAGSDPAAVVFDAIQAAKARKTDILILDTAGRLHNKQNLMDELMKIRRIIRREAPDASCQTLLVIDATTGQNAVSQTKFFREASDVTGLVITKLDGNAKGGVVLAVAHETGMPIMLAGLGEGVEDLVDFDSTTFVHSLLPDSDPV
ncbi:MAG: signal recognition particle-docking protein FtsY [Saccharofermentanales bacterium]|jgi:fused signal recognition particle receptor|nr:signal recognition particle-docking protein FtsY [Clostridiaceae bacterium]